MRKVVLSVAAALAVSAAPAFAAELPVKAAPVAPAAAPSPWDIAFGSAIMNDYVFRGVTQSDHKPSVAAYFEPRYNINPNLQLYVGLSGESIKFPNEAAAEIDFYGGVRPTFGPLAFDFGFWYYWYPGGTCYGAVGCLPGHTPAQFIKADLSFWEAYAKVTWTVVDPLAIGGNFYYTPSFLNSGADGEYASVTAKYTAPANMTLGPFGWYVSGELGYQWLGTTDSFYGTPAFPGGIPLADYATWNLGVGLTWKVFTLDLRYSDTNLSKSDCYLFSGDPGATFNPAAVSGANPGGFESNWCGATFIAKLSADLTLGSLK